MKLYWMSEDSIIKQIRNEYDIWFESVDTLRAIREEDKKLYYDANVDLTKIQIRTVLQWHRMKLAIRLQARPKIKWERRRAWDTERATNVNRVMQYDYEEMGLDKIDYYTEDNISKIGVGIQVNWKFNTNTITPSITNVDPLKWIPDPSGWATIEDHRWCWFENNYMQMYEMEKLWFKNLDSATPRTQVRSETQQANSNWLTEVIDDSVNREYDVYIHFFIRDGKKYKAYTNGDKTVLHYLEYLKPVTEEEKKDEDLVCSPVMLKYAFYIQWSPFGLSTADLLKDTQSNLSRLYNLYIAMVYRNTFWGDRLIRAWELEDPDSLNTPTIEGKDIPVKNGTRALSDIVYEVPREQTTQMQNNMIELLKRNGAEALWAEAVQQGVLSQENKTLWEQEMAQKNANIQFALEEKIMTWWEKFRWKQLWFRQYLANMKSAEIKDISLSQWVTTEFYAFKKDDFVGKEILPLTIRSTSDISEDASNKAEKAVILQWLIAWATSKWEKQKYYRMWAELAWFSDNQISEIVAKTWDEIGAELKLERINAWIESWAVIDSMDDDHETYIRIISTADPSDLKDKALKARYEAIRLRDQHLNWKTWDIGAEQAWASANASMMTSNMLQWQSQTPTNLW